MSVWSDMGLVNARMYAVNPCTFMNTAYGFFRDLRLKLWPADDPNVPLYLPDYDFSLHRRCGDKGGAGSAQWPELDDTKAPGYRNRNVLSFPDVPSEYLGFPVPESYWNSIPKWSEIFTYTEKMLIGEDVMHSPYYEYGERPSRNDPAWPIQRYKVIQAMRYTTIPINIRVKDYDRYTDTATWHEWHPTFFPYNHSINDPNFPWAVRYEYGGYLQIEAEVPEYWTQGNTVCKIGYEGGWNGPGWEVDPPISGCVWNSGNRFLSSEYTGKISPRAIVRLYGAADLATHPDFEQYFDTNEKEEQ